MKLEKVCNNNFIFFTHAFSVKVNEIERDPRVSLNFLFGEKHRQVVVSGLAHIHATQERERIWKLLSLERLS
jgi:pyridoxine/pyridoxamine 5'-phosphate oxidase